MPTARSNRREHSGIEPGREATVRAPRSFYRALEGNAKAAVRDGLTAVGVRRDPCAFHTIILTTLSPPKRNATLGWRLRFGGESG
jgi:hypothetical protein